MRVLLCRRHQAGHCRLDKGRGYEGAYCLLRETQRVLNECRAREEVSVRGKGKGPCLGSLKKDKIKLPGGGGTRAQP